jgi:hypothetical protein
MRKLNATAKRQARAAHGGKKQDLPRDLPS